MVEGQGKTLIQTLALSQGNMTLIQEQRPVEAICAAHRANLIGKANKAENIFSILNLEMGRGRFKAH